MSTVPPDPSSTLDSEPLITEDDVTYGEFIDEGPQTVGESA